MPPRTPLHLILDKGLLEEIEETRETLRLARLSEQFNSQGLADETPRLERRLWELAEKASQEAIRFKFRSLPGEEFDDLCRRHPPTSEDLERFREQAKAMPWVDLPRYNETNMGPDLLVACLTEPRWGEARIRKFWKGLSKGEQNQLVYRALDFQLAGADLPFFDAATATTNGGGDRSTTPANEASPSKSS